MLAQKRCYIILVTAFIFICKFTQIFSNDSCAKLSSSKTEEICGKVQVENPNAQNTKTTAHSMSSKATPNKKKKIRSVSAATTESRSTKKTVDLTTPMTTGSEETTSTESTSTKNTQAAKSKTKSSKKKAGSLMEGSSTTKLHNRIINGTSAELGQFPWLALLSMNRNGHANSGTCSGSLISDQFVLTAAHCINNLKYLQFFSNVFTEYN